MEAKVAVELLTNLGVGNAQKRVSSLQDGSTQHIRTDSGATLALVRRGDMYDSLLVGIQANGPVFPLRKVLEDAFLPLSEDYAAKVGVATSQRDTIRKGIREVAVALDVIANGRMVSVPPPDFPRHSRLQHYVNEGCTSINTLPESFIDDLTTLNQLQANVVSWAKEVDRVVHVSRVGPGTVLSAEEETVFWSSLDAALSSAEMFISSPVAKISLDILARKRRATGFLIETSVTLATARRNSAAVLGLVEGLPLVALRTAEDVSSLKDAVIKLLEHIASKVRGSAFSVDRSLSLIHAMGDDVTHSVARILSKSGDLLSISFSEFTIIIKECCELFEAWSHGFDTCRQVVREAARMRGESVPRRVRSQISRLYSHLTELYELRTDHHSLQKLLTELTDSGHPSRRIEMLDMAYSSLQNAIKNFNHFEMSDNEETAWFDASSSYRSSVKQVEDLVCSDYFDLIERSSSLSSLARNFVPFALVVDKDFMSSCVEESLPPVLQLADRELRALLSRERVMNSRDIKQVINGIPVIITVLLESLQICERAATITESVEAIVGKARMSMMPDLTDFANGVRVLIERLQPGQRFSSWLNEVVAIPVKKSLLCVEKHSNDRMHLCASIDTRVAFFFVVYSLKTKFSRVPLSRSHSELSILSRAILPVFTDLRQALHCHNAIICHLTALDAHKMERILPFIYELLENSEVVLQKGFSLRWNSESIQLSSYSSSALKFFSNLYHKYFFVIENDSGIETVIQTMIGLRPIFEKGILPKDFVLKIREMFDLISAIRSALLLNFPFQVVEVYMRKSWRAKLVYILLNSLSEALVAFFDFASASKLSQLQLSLLPEQKNGRVILNCFPSITSAEEYLYNCIGSVYLSFKETVEFGFEKIGVPVIDARSLSLDLLRSSMTVNEVPGNDGRSLSPFQRIRQEVTDITTSIEEWLPYVKYLNLQSESNSASAELNQSALESLSQLAEVHDSIISLTDSPGLEPGSRLISLSTTSLREQILSSVKDSIMDRAKICATESAISSQSLYSKISEAHNLLGDVSSGNILDAVVCLHEMKEDILPFCREAVERLLHREKLFERLTNNILQASLPLLCDVDTWILYRDLKPHLDRLESLYEGCSRSALANTSLLLAKYEDLRSHYQVRMGAIFADFQEVRGKDFVDETYLDMEELLQDLEHQLLQLENDSVILERLASVLRIDSEVDRNGPSGILKELNRLRDSLRRLGEISEQLEVIGKISLSKTNFPEVEMKLKNFQGDIEQTTLRTGKSQEALKLSSLLSRRLQELGLLEALLDVEISPPRERDVLKKLFNGSFSKEGLKLLPLHEFWENDILSHELYLKEVFKVAAGESQICDFLRLVEGKWSARKCIFSYQDDVPLLQGIPEFLDELEEHIQALGTMKASPHAKLFESDRAAWEKRLALAREKIELLADVQSRWAHLRTLFVPRSSSSGSMIPIGELTEEMSAFVSVNARFSSIGSLISNSPGLVEGLEVELGLEDMLEELRGIVRGLSRFLEKQRVQFPRFFFLSDDDLLHVLSTSSSNIDGVQTHVSKLFPGLARINFAIDNTNVKVFSAQSSEGEVLIFSYPITISNKPIVVWLQDLQDAIRCSVKESLVEVMRRTVSFYKTLPVAATGCFQQFRNSSIQVSVLALRIRFTESVDHSLQNSSESVKELNRIRDCVEQNLSVVCSLRSCPADVDTLDSVFSLFRNHLIKEFVYQRDLVTRLLSTKCIRLRKHTWQNELRFVAKPNGKSSDGVEVYVYCSCACFEYGWEYLGVGEALVRTSLTSRCILILSEAIRRGYGGSPFGPAGTGKTETVKSFGRSLGRTVSVFNCDESFDSISVGRILAGVCRLGCWVCFDEFNRLSESSLSSTSGQLVAIQDAIRKDEKEIPNFYGGEFRITISSGLSIFVTMNPTYTGRRELPANLRSLFRPCAMSKPDSESIAEVMLLSENFNFSTVLSKKLVTFFDALGSTLTEQPHYDFGLRSLKNTIVVCGSLSRLSVTAVETTVELEEDCIVRGVDEVLKPKLDVRDLLDYDNLLSSTFSLSSSVRNVLPSDLSRNIQKIIEERNLLPHPTFLEKVRQLYSLLQHHCGVMMVGSVGTGKSTTWRVLFEAMKQTATCRHSNPSGDGKSSRSSLTVIDAKLLSAKQLYGSMDTLTREWSDGLFTAVLRTIADERVAAIETPFPLHWIVFDGDVDPDWIETLNSVLDDNRMLTLPNGEQIPFLSNTRIIFETDHLRHANPSSVSRCGMICFGDDAILKALLKSRVIESLMEISPSYQVPSFMGELTNIISNVAGMLVKKGLVVMDVSIHSLHHSFLTLFSNTLHIHLSRRPLGHQNELLSKNAGSGILTDDVVVKIALTSAVKAMSSGLGHSDRQELSNNFLSQVRDVAGVERVLQGIAIPCLADVDLLPNGEFIEYGELLSSSCNEEVQRDIGSPDIVVPTPTTVRLEHLLQDILNLSSNSMRYSCPLILCGPPGCGKSMILTAALRGIPNVSLATLSFSSETSTSNILLCLKGHTLISKRPNGTYVMHPKSTGCRVILFCDEVNLVRPDRYETQASVFFLRSMAELGGFWMGSPPYWVSIEGIQIVAACNPPDDAGRHELSPRFLRHCFVVRVEEPVSDDLKIIYGSFIDVLLRQLNPHILSKRDSLTSAMVEFYSCNKERYSPSKIGPLKAHYIYSPRDLSRWIRGMSILLAYLFVDSSPNESILNDQEKETIWVDVISAFCYEARRLFRDRLVSQEERDFVENKLLEIVSNFLMNGLTSVPEVLYTSWMKNDECPEKSDRTFRIVEDSQVFRSLIYEKLRAFSEEQGLGGTWISGTGEGQVVDNDVLDQFAVTDDVLTHLTRIERILCQPLGHAVLIGSSGTGKKTLARFAAWMLSIEVHQVRSNSSYSELQFAKDLREILRRASIHNQNMLMIFDESHAMETAFLEMMNSLLACGEVPGLFNGEEKAQLLNDLRQASSHGSSTEQALYSEFVHRIRRNLHIIFTISMAPSSERVKSKRSNTLSDLSKRSPALYNRCTCDWIGDWGRETLHAVAELKIEVAQGSDLEPISNCTVEIHEAARDFIDSTAIVTSVTPRHYLEFIEQLNRITLEKGGNIETGVERYKKGLGRLRAAADAVEDLKESLSTKAEDLRLMESHANDMLQKMMEEQRLAEKSKIEAEQLALAAEEASTASREREEDVAAQLNEVLPKIEAARKAVGSIRKECLEELRAMPNPPEAVRLALEAVIMMLDGSVNRVSNPLEWNTIRSRMRSSDFISSVVSFDGSSLPRSVRSRIQNRIIKNASFDVDKITYASQAAGPLAQWTLAVLDFVSVQESVEPLQQQVTELQRQQSEYIQRQEAALCEAFSFQERIDECRVEYARLVSESEKIRQDISESESNLAKVERTLDSLTHEWNRWIRDMKILGDSAGTVWGDSVFAAAFIAYAGSFDYLNRTKLSSIWKAVIAKHRIPFDNDMSIATYLTTPEQRGRWSANGLPVDASSLENYAILRRSARFPLIVDPTRGCAELLKHVLKVPNSSGSTSSAEEMRIAVSTFSATGKKSYMRALESAVRFGTIIILEDAERYDRVLTPLLGQEVFFSDNQKQRAVRNEKLQGTKVGTQKFVTVCQRVVRLGDRDVYLNSNFSMFLTTSNVERVPQAAVTRANVVSFELSAAALGSTCVSRSLNILAPEIERRRVESLSALVELENRKRNLEEKVLLTINEVDDLGTKLLSGPLLEDLTSLKREVEVIDKRQKEEGIAAQKIKEKEIHFEPLGKTAVDIFFVIQSLTLINSMYRFNTEFFLNLFDAAIQRSLGKDGNETPVSLQNCQDSLLEQTLGQLLSSLFPSDRLPFAASVILVSSFGGIPHEQTNVSDIQPQALFSAWRLSLTRLEKLLDGQKAIPSEMLVSGLPESLKRLLQNNTNLEGRRGEVFLSSLAVLKASLENPHELSTSFERLVCVFPECQKIIQGTNTGPESALYSTLNTFVRMRKNPKTGERIHFRPLLLCVRGETCDPAASVMDFSNDAKISLMSLAMGSSITGDTLISMISSANRKCDEGRRVVVLIKNMHLSSRTAMDCLQSEMAKGKGALPCLLVVVVEVSSDFSKDVVLSLSPYSHVLAFESPPSFRTNFSLAMQKSTKHLSKNGFHSCLNDNIVQGALALISWLHASVLERTLHSPIGFTKAYDFSEADLIAGLDIFQALLHDVTSPDIGITMSLSNLLASCVYGCRVEHDSDYDVIQALINSLLCWKQFEDAEKLSEVSIVFSGTETLTIPLSSEKLSDFIKKMNIHAAAKWCRLPSDTGVFSQSKEGADVLRKVLLLSNEKFFEPEKITKNVRNDSVKKVIDFEPLILKANAIPNVSDEIDWHSKRSSLSQFIKRELEIVMSFVRSIKADVSNLTEDKNKREATEIKIFRENVEDLLQNGNREVPSRWQRFSKCFGNEMNMDELLVKVKECAELVQELRPSQTVIDMRAILRPRALFTAMRYEESKKLGIAPHHLHPVVYGGSDYGTRRDNEYILSGLRLTGAEWDSDAAVFKVSDMMAPLTTEQFTFRWRPMQYNTPDIKDDDKHGLVQISIYGRGQCRTMIWCVDLVTLKGEQLAKWRLNGVCLTVR